MRWDDVGQAIFEAVKADATLLAIFGDGIRMSASAQDHIVPGLEYQIVGDTANELWEPIIVQWDLWTNHFSDLIGIRCKK